MRRDRWSLVPILTLLVSGCAAGPTLEGDPFSPVSQRAGGGDVMDLQVQVESDWTTVARVSLLSGGGEIPLGRVQPRERRVFRVPGGATTGVVELIARPHGVFSVSEPYRSVPFQVKARELVVWRLHASPARAGNPGGISNVQIVRCAMTEAC